MKRSFDFQVIFLVENWILTHFLIKFIFKFEIKT